jgi:hypothetical protein
LVQKGLLRQWWWWWWWFQQMELGCRNAVSQCLSMLLPETFIMRLWLSSGTCPSHSYMSE